ncbi:MAG: hypothetical protein WBV23_00745, partial [Desulfobaccales bacterium]
MIDRRKKANNLFNMMGGGAQWIRRLEPHSKNRNPDWKESPEVEEKKRLGKWNGPLSDSPTASDWLFSMHLNSVLSALFPLAPGRLGFCRWIKIINLTYGLAKA